MNIIFKISNKFFWILSIKKLINWIPDKTYLKIFYYLNMNKKLNIEKPETFNEKLQWLKLNDRKKIYTRLVDKFEVREYIKNKIGEEYLVPLIGVWDNFDEIDFSILPNKFVLKTTHDSGGVVVCRNKEVLNIEHTREIINKSLKRNWYYITREWPYKDVKPKIICEQLIETKDGSAPTDYKFHCFNGVPDNVMLCLERESGNTKFYFFNEKWELLRYNITGKNAKENFTLPKPKKMDEMFSLARELSRDFKFIRVDLYCEDEKIYFGELTFYPQSGIDYNLLNETDILFGKKIKCFN